uniref:Uncharacterized protein n=1 Tax=Aegilops tauschii subsp. strangulata TaxID=200361 RepID=A0A453NIU2_AEGTS
MLACILFLCSCSWPLALVGKFIPVPQTPLKNLILKCWPKKKKQGDEGAAPPV